MDTNVKGPFIVTTICLGSHLSPGPALNLQSTRDDLAGVMKPRMESRTLVRGTRRLQDSEGVDDIHSDRFS
jgi:hypothetical protein